MTLFFELINIAIGRQQELSYTPSEAEWQHAYDIAMKQTMVGICVAAIQKLPSEQRPQGMTFLIWTATTASIHEMNKLMNQSCAHVQEDFRQKGFQSCLLKGQGISLYYGDMGKYRQCGDIDAWLWPCHADGSLQSSLSRHERRQGILSMVRSIKPDCKPVYHNVAIDYEKGIEVEIHFTPTWLYSPIHNARLQRWMESRAEDLFRHSVMLEGGQQVIVPDTSFNLVYILLHIYRHLFGEGIGLRQVLDYYFVLLASTEEERREAMRTLRSFGAGRFVGALMWILHTRFGMEEDRLLCKADEKDGRFLLKEMMIAGNFGYHDSRINRQALRKGLLSGFLEHVGRNMHFITHYPSEVLWCPLWKLWHQWWLRKNNIR